jgi:DNA-binding protein YbaB
MVGDLQRVRENLGASQQRMMRVRGEASSEDRLIKATVGPRGQLIDLELDPRVFRNPNSKALATAIVATVRAAVDDAQRQSRAIRDELLPTDLKKLAEGRRAEPDLLAVQDADLEDDDA